MTAVPASSRPASRRNSSSSRTSTQRTARRFRRKRWRRRPRRLTTVEICTTPPRSTTATAAEAAQTSCTIFRPRPPATVRTASAPRRRPLRPTRRCRRLHRHPSAVIRAVATGARWTVTRMRAAALLAPAAAVAAVQWSAIRAASAATAATRPRVGAVRSYPPSSCPT